MKRLIIVTLCFCVSVCSTGCAPILKIVLGVRSPSPKSEIQIERKKKKYKLIEFENLMATDSGCLKYLEIDGKRNGNSGGYKLYPLLFYHGQLISPKSNKSCNAYGTELVSALRDTNQYVLDTVSIFDVLNSNTIVGWDSLPYRQQIESCEYIFLVYWASFEGVFNKKNNKRNAQFFQKEKSDENINGKAFYVNFDMKNNWIPQLR